MTKVRVIGSVNFSTSAGLVRYDPDDWAMEVEGRIVGAIERDEQIVAEDESVGELAAVLVMTTQAMNDQINLADVCDAHSDSLLEAYAAVFNKKEIPKKELKIEPAWDGFLFVQSITVKAEYRQSGVVAQAIETTIRCYCPGGIVVAHSDLDLTIDEWRQLGFMKISGSDFRFRDNTCLNPYGLSVPEDE